MRHDANELLKTPEGGLLLAKAVLCTAMNNMPPECYDEFLRRFIAETRAFFLQGRDAVNAALQAKGVRA